MDRPRRKPWKRARVVVPAALLLFVCGVLYAVIRTPGWYAPPVIAPHERQAVRDSLVDAEQAFTQTLRAGGAPFTYMIHQDDLNRWIAMRAEIYPQAGELTPPELRDPYVRFEEDRITLAGRLAAGPVEVVVSLRLAVQCESDAVVVTSDGWRCGSAPIPERWLGTAWARPVDLDPGETWPGSPPIWGDLKRGLRIGADAWWKNGGIEYRVLRAWVEPGVLKLSVQPLGPHFATARSRQD